MSLRSCGLQLANLPVGQISDFLSSLFSKKISVFNRPKSSLYPALSRALLEGRIAIVTDVGREMRWTRQHWARLVACDERSCSGRRSRVVLTPRCWRQVGGSHSADDGGKQARSPGRARRKPLKPLRGECRVFSGVTVVTCLRAFYFCTQGCGRIERPAFPAPSVEGRALPSWGSAAPSEFRKAGRCWQNSRETCGEIARLCFLNLAPLAGRGRRRSAAKSPGEGASPRGRLC
jgi:hypothetical protein